MKRFGICFLTLGAILLFVTPVMAQQSLIDTVANGCKAELEKYCSNVTPGEGRILACLYAYGDKLSGRCEYALYEARGATRTGGGRPFLCRNECSADLKKYCAGVEAAEGRLACRRTIPR